MRILILSAITIPLVSLFSCHKIEVMSPIPFVEYRSFEVFDTIDALGNREKAGRLKFYFEDGDGDLGLNAPQSEGEQATNLFFTLYRKIDGVMTPAPDNDPLKTSPFRIPYMERQGINKMLKGIIAVTIIYPTFNAGDDDTIMYDFYMTDRAGNDSNTATTSEITLSKNGVY
jgi:hypothetical protein